MQPKRRKEHPEDRVMRLKSQRKARRLISGFTKGKERQLVGLILTYADREAHAKLDRLREDFWSLEEFSA